MWQMRWHFWISAWNFLQIFCIIYSKIHAWIFLKITDNFMQDYCQKIELIAIDDYTLLELH